MNARPFCYACGTALALAGVTGAALALGYVPTSSHAWLSVLGMQEQWGGGFVRGLHRAATEAALVSGALAVAIALASNPRAVQSRARIGLWLLALGLVVGLVVTGNPLRDDNAGRFALSVEVNVLGSLPLIGGVLRRALIGSGPEQTVLARLFTRHAVLLPGLLVLVLGVSRVVGAGHSTTGQSEVPNPEPARGPFDPDARDLGAALICILSVAISAFFRGAPLGAPADLESAFPARPAWYFQPLYLSRQLLPAERAPLFTLLGLLVGSIAFALLLWPRSPGARLIRRSRRNLIALGILALYGGMAAFGALKDARDPQVVASLRQERWSVARVAELQKAGASLKLGARKALNGDPLHRARALFSEHCANCHALGDLGPSDGLARAPNLTGFGTRAWVLAMLDDPDAADRFGNTPFSGKMPSVTRAPADPSLREGFRPMAVADQQAIADFLSAQALSGAAPDLNAPNIALGERLVRERCTSCHLYAGKTDDDESQAPELLGWASPPWISAHVLNPRSGRTYRPGPKTRGQMPSFGGVLSHEELSLLVDFVRGAVATEARPVRYQAQTEGSEPANEGG